MGAVLGWIYGGIVVRSRRAVGSASERVRARKARPARDMVKMRGRRKAGGEGGQGVQDEGRRVIVAVVMMVVAVVVVGVIGVVVVIVVVVGVGVVVGVVIGVVVGCVFVASLGIARGDVWGRRIGPLGARRGAQQLHIQIARPRRTRGPAPPNGRARQAGGVLERVCGGFWGRGAPYGEAHDAGGEGAVVVMRSCRASLRPRRRRRRRRRRREVPTERTVLARGSVECSVGAPAVDDVS